MRAILNHCGDIPLEHVPGGTVLLEEGQNTGRVYVLAQGRIEVIRGDTQVAVLDEPGSLVGEMSVLLGVPHTATARTLGNAKVHVINDGKTFCDRWVNHWQHRKARRRRLVQGDADVGQDLSVPLGRKRY